MGKGTKIQLIIIIVLVIILAILAVLCIKEIDSNTISNSTADTQMEMPQENGGGQGNTGNSETADTTGATEITDTQTLSDQSFESTESDESAILVKDGGNLTLENATVNKTGDTSNTENSEFYGVNAGILAQTDATITISDSTITTDAKGANAVFATGENAKIYISDSTIETSSDSSRGLDATYGGYIEADNVTISTKGGSCATLATDRGEGTVIAKNSTLSTAGSGSPVIYSTGNITLEDSEGTATGAQMVVIEGKNSATVTNSVLSCYANGNRGDVDIAGIMIYQSMSGDADEGTGTFTASGSTLEIDSDSSYYESAPFFFITNTAAVINLEDCELIYGSDILLKVEGTDEWGTSGNNGGDVEFNATNQVLEGDITVDNISTVTLSLTDGSSYTGTINGDNTAKSIILNLSSDSKITLTGDTYVTELNDDVSDYSNIDFNGYTLYVNGVAVN